MRLLKRYQPFLVVELGLVFPFREERSGFF
jgi:hypothetical protein